MPTISRASVLPLLAVVLTVWSGAVNLKDGLRLRREALAGSA